MQGRVAWDRYEGNNVEAVVAMMLNREHPNSVRITPSQGDGGVDILDRGAAAEGGDVVYQVKRYAGPLTAGQKTKIKKSLQRLLDSHKGDPRWKELHVTVWRLATPWDPSPEADKWLQGLGKTYGVTVIWDGLTDIDQLAAKYPDVIDYYLHDGKSAVQEAYREAMTLMSLDGAMGDELTVPEVTARVEKALKTLDKDPHYRYEPRFGHGEPAEPPHRPRLVFSWYCIDRQAATWQAVDVLARCAASVDERPITITGHLKAEEGSAFAAAVKGFFEFGTPFTSPEGAYTGQFDAPGGLGGELVNASIRTSPVTDADLGENTELRLQVLDPDGQVLAEVHVDRTDRSSGTAGLRVVLSEVNGVFRLEELFNLAEQTAKASFKLLPIDGKPVAAVWPAAEFLAAFHDPNSLRVSARHAPPHRGPSDPIPPLVEEAMTEQLGSVANLLGLLNGLQQNTDTVIVVPDLENFAKEQYRVLQFVATILKGDSVTLTAQEGHAFHVVLEAGTTAPQESFSMVLPLKALVGEQTIHFGAVRAELTDPKLLGQATTNDGRLVYQFMTPDRTLRYTLHDQSE